MLKEALATARGTLAADSDLTEGLNLYLDCLERHPVGHPTEQAMFCALVGQRHQLEDALDKLRAEILAAQRTGHDLATEDLHDLIQAGISEQQRWNRLGATLLALRGREDAELASQAHAVAFSYISSLLGLRSAVTTLATSFSLTS